MVNLTFLARRHPLLFGTIVSAVILIIGYFILQANLEKVSKSFISKATNGKYLLEMDNLKLSFLKGKIELVNAGIFPSDTTVPGDQYRIFIPAFKITTKSWIHLITGKVDIDSIYISNPKFAIYKNGPASVPLRPGIAYAKLVEDLKAVMNLLSIRSLKLESGIFQLYPNSGADPFTCKGVNILVESFGKSVGHAGTFLAADEFRITMPAQKWLLNDGLQRIEFKSFEFTSSRQYFEIDSFSLRNKSSGGYDSILLRVDQFGFKASDLKAFYENNSLEFDTVWCLNPSLQMHLQKEQTTTDSTIRIFTLLNKLPFRLSVDHLDLVGGQLNIDMVRNEKTLAYVTESVNLNVDRIAINPEATPVFSTGPIQLNAQNLSFYTPDSLYTLTLLEFEINDNDIRLLNAAFRPTAANKDQSFSAIISEFIIVDIDLDELLEQRIAASKVILSSPVISISNPIPVKTSGSPAKNDISVFYDALHGLSRLLAVNNLVITDGTLNYTSGQPAPVDAKVTGLHVEMRLKEFLKVRALVDVKKSITLLEAGQLLLNTGKLHVGLNRLRIHGNLQHNNIESFQVQVDEVATLTGKDIYWQQLDWDQLKVNKALISDSIYFKYLKIETMAAGPKAETPAKDLPVIHIRKLSGNMIDINAILGNNSNLSTSCQHVTVTELASSGSILQWQAARADFNNTLFVSEKTTASIHHIQLNSLHTTSITGITLSLENPTGEIKASIASAAMELPLRSTDFSALNIPSLTILDPKFSFEKQHLNASGITPFSIPVDLTIGNLVVKRANAAYNHTEGSSSTVIKFSVDLMASKIQLFKEQLRIASIQQVALTVYDQSVSGPRAASFTRSLNLIAEGLNLRKTGSGRDSGINVSGNLSGQWSDFSLSMEMPESGGSLQVSHLSGSLNPTDFLFSKKEEMNWINWVQQLNISNGRIEFSDTANTIIAGKVSWNPVHNILQVSDFAFEPKMKPDAYFAKTIWQSDYINASVDNLAVSGIDLNRLYRDTVFIANGIEVINPVINVWRDKRIPFKHGIEKNMPTPLLLSSNGKTGLKIDSLLVKNGNVYYHEFSSVTNQLGIVPLQRIDAVITNLKNMDIKTDDSLTILGTMELFGSAIKKIKYQESYFDTLSSFNMTFIGSPMQLTEISHVSKPLAAIQVNSGECNILSASISGNKNAAFGELRFFYRDLNVSLLDHHDSLRNRIDLAFVNLIANKFVVKTNNRKKSIMFFVRDQERFVFSYWIKTVMSGVLTSSGVKRDKKYYKTYQDLRQLYNLPEMEF